jgi:two-component system sensor histidine kinase/response regulator
MTIDPSGPSIDPPLILIAEDSATQAARLTYVLERNGYRVAMAKNGLEALHAAKARKPSLIITDIMMPEMDGYGLCERIKSDPDLCDVPVILVTTLSDPQDVINGLKCRADNFITKPLEEKLLLSRINSLLHRPSDLPLRSDANGVEIYFGGERHLITADRVQILNLLLSTYEAAIHRNQELVRTKDELRSANAALEVSNQELEAFSYSVSHDLRAPLRAIDGFNRSFLEDYGHTLEPDGRELLLSVQRACERMGNLIEDLLSLARIARSEMNRTSVDLGAMARSIVDELRRSDPGRQVDVRIEDGLVADGDARLLHVALSNLLSNAWKFTSKCPQAVIEFGSTRQGGQTTFFLRDNGAGFDMAYAEKLFGAFQRLHSADEFPGTGVGLATVHRIIHRHGGRIWADSAVNKGTTFHFTL